MGSAERAWLAAAQRAVRQCNRTLWRLLYLFFRTPVFQCQMSAIWDGAKARGPGGIDSAANGRRTNLKVVEGAKGGLKGPVM
jgi:hypothetical protein